MFRCGVSRRDNGNVGPRLPEEIKIEWGKPVDSNLSIMLSINCAFPAQSVETSARDARQLFCSGRDFGSFRSNCKF